MHGLLQFIILLIALAIGNGIYKIYMAEPLKPPSDTWWGPEDKKSSQDTSLRPFRISVSEKVLEDLKFRLKNSRPLAPPLNGVEQQYGINTNLLNEIVQFWLNKYDWKERQQFLNQYPQFRTNIQGLDIHYIHVRPQNVPPGVKVLPLLLSHGWPGSVREFYEMIPLLTKVHKDKNFVFELIVPSLPGYGFSDPANKPGLGAPQVTVIFKNLMIRLGFERFYVQGGDWGAAIATYMAIFYPEKVLGLHSNMCFSNEPVTNIKLALGSIWPSLVVDEKYAKRIYPLTKFISNMFLEFGYMHIQATKPDTVGVALTDSPVGLAGYILEKFTTWTNPEFKNRSDGGLTEKFDYTKLLDNIMIYWVTNSITSSMRLYSESLNKEQNVLTQTMKVKVPSACAIFDNEFIIQPPSWLKERYVNLIQASELSGGHFAAFEVPEVLAKDVWEAVSKFQSLKS